MPAEPGLHGFRSIRTHFHGANGIGEGFDHGIGREPAQVAAVGPRGSGGALHGQLREIGAAVEFADDRRRFRLLF